MEKATAKNQDAVSLPSGSQRAGYLWTEGGCEMGRPRQGLMKVHLVNSCTHQLLTFHTHPPLYP